MQFLHELLKWHILVGVSLDGDFLETAQYFPKRRIASEVRPHHKRINEESDKRFCFDLITIGYRRAYQNIVLSCVSVDYDLESGQQRQKQGRILALAQLLERRC